MSESKHTPKTITLNKYLSRSQIDCDFGIDCGHQSEMGGTTLNVVHESGREHFGQVVIFGDTQPEDDSLLHLILIAPETAADRDRLKAENAEKGLQIGELIGFLLKYGGHLDYCPTKAVDNMPCSCGFAGLLAHQPTADNESEAGNE